MSPSELTYSLHGLRLTLSSEDEDALEVLRGRFQYLPPAEAGPTDLQLRFTSVPADADHAVPIPGSPGRPMEELGRLGSAWYDEDSDRLCIDHDGRIHAVAHLREGTAEVSISLAQPYNLWRATHPVVSVLLFEMLKRRGLYSLHAAGLETGGKTLLLGGGSGSGKTTLTLLLLAAGFGMLGDDTVFLSREKERLRILGFPEEIDLTPETARMLPELAFLERTPTRPGWPKHQIDVRKVYGTSLVWTGEPDVLVFPRIAHQERTELIPMEHGEALMRLLGNMNRTDSRIAQAHLDSLGQLARESRCYRMETGTDFEAQPTMLRELVERE